MKPEHIKIIHDAFNAFGNDDYKMSLLSTDIHCGQYTDKFLAWNVFRHCKIEENTTLWICNTLYPYINDRHIDTILLKEFKILKDKIESKWNEMRAE